MSDKKKKSKPGSRSRSRSKSKSVDGSESKNLQKQSPVGSQNSLVATEGCDTTSETGSAIMNSDEDNTGEAAQAQLLPAMSGDSVKNVDESSGQARLDALLDAAGIRKFATGSGEALSDPDVLRKLTSSVSTALDEAAFALSKMRTDGQGAQGAEADLAAVGQVLAGGQGLSETNEDGESLLSLACSAGYFELAQVLLAMRANVEDRGIKGDCTPLMEAASGGHTDIVKLLVKHGADVNAQSTAGNTALHYAACGGFEEVVRTLIEHRANVEEHNENGHTPLMEAASAGHVGCAHLLLSAGAGINTHSNEFKESALTLACYKGHLEMVKYLLEAGADHEHKTDEMHTALMEAAMDGHVEVAQLLLDNGAEVNMPMESFESPLTLAACGDHVNLAELLITRGADLEEGNDEGYTPLMEASREGHVDMVQLLLSHGCNVNCQTEETQETALTLACCGGFIDVARLLIEAGADIELGCSSPLMEAAQEGQLELVKYLLEQGADVNAQTGTGDTALSWACENRHTDVAHILVDSGADIEHKSEGGRTPLMKAVRGGHLCTVQYLVSKGANVNCVTALNDHTVLSLACSGGYYNIVEFLLQHGADPSHKLKDGSTMLIEAAKGGHSSVVNLLLEWPAASLASAHYLSQAAAIANLSQQYLPAGYNQLDYPLGQFLPPGAQGTPATEAEVAVQDEILAGSEKTLEQLQLRQQEIHRQQQLFHSTNQLLFDHQQALPGTSDISSSELLRQLYDNSISALDQARISNVSDHDKQRQILEQFRRIQENVLIEQLLAKQGVITGGQANSPALPLLDEAHDKSKSGSKKAEKEARPLHEVYRHELNKKVNMLPEVPNDQSVLPVAQTTETSEPAATDQHSPMPLHLVFKDELAVQLEAQQRAAAEGLSPVSVEVRLDDNTYLSALARARSSPVLNGEVNIPAADSNGTNSSQDSSQDAPDSEPEPLVSSQEEYEPGSNLSVINSLINAISNTAADLDKIRRSENCNTDAQRNKRAILEAKASYNQLQLSQAILQYQRHMGTQQQQQLQQQQFQQLQQQQQQLTQQSYRTAQAESLHDYAQPQQAELKVDVEAKVSVDSSTAAQLNSALAANAFTPKQLAAYHGLTSEQQKQVLISLQQAGIDASYLRTVSQQMQGKLLEETQATPPPYQSQAHIPDTDTSGLLEAAESVRQHYAAAGNQLLDLNAQTESNHDTALTLACHGGHTELVKLLLERGAEIEHKDKKGFTPLILAATGGHSDVVTLLLDKGADLEAFSERTKDTPLSLACSGGRFDVVSLLLTKGANKEHRNVSDYTPLSLAASGGFVNIVKLLLSHGAEINSRTGSKLGISPLMLAAMNGHTAAVKLLLDMGSDINAQIETNKNTALTLACFQGRYEVVSLLVERKANIEHRAKTGLTPLMEAASGGYTDVGRVLLDKGADVNATPVPSSKDTALTIAADKGHYHFVELLIQRGACVDVKNKKGNSPLWLACSGGHLDVVQLLVSAHADIHSSDNRLVTCLVVAFRKGHVKVVKWMVKHVTQFPSDQECNRFLQTIQHDKDLMRRCEQAKEMILTAKERQAVEANKNADILLAQIDMEKRMEEQKKEAKERKKVKKQQKKKEKKKKEEQEKMPTKESTTVNAERSSTPEPEPIEEPPKPLVNGARVEVEPVPPTVRETITAPIPAPSAAEDETGMSKRRRKNKRHRRQAEQTAATDKQLTAASSQQNDVTSAGRLAKDVMTEQPERLARVPDHHHHPPAHYTSPRQGQQHPTTSSKPVRNLPTTAVWASKAQNNHDNEEARAGKNRQTNKQKTPLQTSTTSNWGSGDGNHTGKPVKSTHSPRKQKKEEDWTQVSRRVKKLAIPGSIVYRVVGGRNAVNLTAIAQHTGASLELEKSVKGASERYVTIKGNSAECTHEAYDYLSRLVNDPEKSIDSVLPTRRAQSKASNTAGDMAHTAHTSHENNWSGSNSKQMSPRHTRSSNSQSNTTKVQRPNEPSLFSEVASARKAGWRPTSTNSSSKTSTSSTSVSTAGTKQNTTRQYLPFNSPITQVDQIIRNREESDSRKNFASVAASGLPVSNSQPTLPQASVPQAELEQKAKAPGYKGPGLSIATSVVSSTSSTDLGPIGSVPNSVGAVGTRPPSCESVPMCAPTTMPSTHSPGMATQSNDPGPIGSRPLRPPQPSTGEPGLAPGLQQHFTSAYPHQYGAIGSAARPQSRMEDVSDVNNPLLRHLRLNVDPAKAPGYRPQTSPRETSPRSAHLSKSAESMAVDLSNRSSSKVSSSLNPSAPVFSRNEPFTQSSFFVPSYGSSPAINTQSAAAQQQQHIYRNPTAIRRATENMSTRPQLPVGSRPPNVPPLGFTQPDVSRLPPDMSRLPQTVADLSRLQSAAAVDARLVAGVADMSRLQQGTKLQELLSSNSGSSRSSFDATSSRDGASPSFGLENSPQASNTNSPRAPLLRMGEALQRAPGETIQLQRAPGDGLSLPRAPAENMQLQRAPGEGMKLQRAPGEGIQRTDVMPRSLDMSGRESRWTRPYDEGNNPALRGGWPSQQDPLVHNDVTAASTSHNDRFKAFNAPPPNSYMFDQRQMSKSSVGSVGPVGGPAPGSNVIGSVGGIGPSPPIASNVPGGSNVGPLGSGPGPIGSGNIGTIGGSGPNISNMQPTINEHMRSNSMLGSVGQGLGMGVMPSGMSNMNASGSNLGVIGSGMTNGVPRRGINHPPPNMRSHLLNDMLVGAPWSDAKQPTDGDPFKQQYSSTWSTWSGGQ